MAITNLPKYVQGQAQAGSIIIYDGCHWTLTTISGGLNCGDVQACISAAYIMSQIGNSPSISKIGNTFHVNVPRLNNNISSVRNSPFLTIGNITHNLSNILNNVQHLIVGTQGGSNTLLNNDQLRFTGIDGLRAIAGPVAGGTQVQIGLPTTNRQPNYVLTWNGTTAVWQPGCDPCCAQIQECMEPIINGIQSQIDTIVGLVGGGGGGGAEDFTVSASYNPITKIATFTRLLGGTYTLDLNPLINSFSDNFLQNVTLTGTVLHFDMLTGTDHTVDLAPLLSPTIQGQDEGNTVVSGITAINFIGPGVTATNGGGGLLNVTIPGGVNTDELVKVRASDTVPSYLFDAINNTVTLVTNNDNTIKKRVVNPLADESLQLVVDLTLYNGDTQFVGNHTQTGNVTVNGTTNLNGTVNIGAGPLNYNNTVTNGIQNFSNTYTANYDGSTINYNDVTQNYTGDNIVNLVDGASITNNLDGTVNNNYGPTYVENNVYQDGATINNEGELTINNNNFVVNHDGTITNNYSDTYVANHNGGTHNYNDVIQNFTNIIQNFISTPNLISCLPIPINFATLYNYATGTQYVELVIEYNNVQKTFKFTPNTGTQTHTVNGEQFSITANATNFQIDIVSGTPSLWDIVSVCFYDGVSVNNYENKIHNHNGDITNNVNTYETNENVTQVFDSNSTIINQGTTILQGDTIIEGNIIINQGALQFTPTIPIANNTGIYPLPDKPSLVFKNGLYMLEGPTYDYVYTLGNVVFNTPTFTTDQIVFL